MHQFLKIHIENFKMYTSKIKDVTKSFKYTDLLDQIE